MFKKISFFVVCLALVLITGGCGGKSELKSELDSVAIENKLPVAEIIDCRYLYEADDEVYDQQIAACEMYYEAYDSTRTTDYIEKYKGRIKSSKIAYLCNDKRKKLQLDIATELSDNVYAMVRSVEDCDNIAAYLKRVKYDTVNFYDYYMNFMESGGSRDCACKILRVFYERSNILAFRFMDEYRDSFIESAVDKIIENSNADDDFNMRIAENNELIKALNTVYGGVPQYYADNVTAANISLARKLLEDDNNLSERDINILMEQLGEPTPTPEPTETPKPAETPEPTEPAEEVVPRSTPTARVTAPPTPAVMVKTPTPATQRPEPTQQTVTPTPEVYIFGD